MRSVVTRTTHIFAIVAWALLVASDAGAVGGVVGSSGDAASVMQARFAVAISPAQTTRWVSIQVEKFPGAMAWLLPIRPGARVDESSDAWFEALELATAPRVVASRCDSSTPAIRVEGLPDRVPTQRSLHSAVLDDTSALRAFAGEWALDLPAEIEGRFEDLKARGFSLVAFLYAGPAGGGFTRTVRITDDSFPAVPLFMTLGGKNAIGVTAFLIGSARARLGAGPELEIDPNVVQIARDGSSDYKRIRSERLLASGGRSWVIETSESELFLIGARRPGAVDLTPPIVPVYDARAQAYGDSTSDPTLALEGQDSGGVWVTRAIGVVPPGGFGDDVAITLAAGRPKNPFVVTTQSPTDCPATVVMQPPMMIAAPPPVLTPPSTPKPRPEPPQEPVMVETTVVDAPPQEPVEVAGSCDGSPQSQPQEDSSNDSCSHSDTSSDTTSDDGCDSSSDPPPDHSDDGCDSSSSNSSQDQGGGCDSSGSNSSSSSSDCSLARRPGRHRSRTSLFAWTLCAVLLPLRRVRRKSRC
jgi:hypothetical protein